MAAVVFFDTETTGLPIWKGGAGHPDQPHIVQLAAIQADKETRKVLQTLSCLIRLKDGVTIHPAALEVHKKSPEMLAAYGYEAKTVLKLFQLMLQSSETVVAHNLSFDSLVYEANVLREQPFLSMDPFRRCEPYCTMHNSTMLCRIPNGKGSFKWPKLNEAWPLLYGEPNNLKWIEGDAHDALFDVTRCMELYWGLQDRMNKL